MKNRTTAGTLTLLLLAGAAMFLQAEQKTDAEAILQKVDELYRASSSVATFEMEIVTPHWQRTLRIKAWSEGMDKTFLRILEPKKERGMATLRIENEMWNYLPKTNKVIKIPPSMMMSSWMGSDFSNDDLVKEYTFLEDYSFEFTTVEQPVDGEIYIRCTPKPDRPIVWGHIIVAVRKSDYLPVWQKYYDEKGNLMREMSFLRIKELGNRVIPSVMELIPVNKEGHKTTVTYLEATFNEPIPQDTFSLRNLRTRM